MVDTKSKYLISCYQVFECPGSPIEDCRERTSSISPQQSDSSSNSSDTRRSMSLSNETLSAPLGMLKPNKPVSIISALFV